MCRVLSICLATSLLTLGAVETLATQVQPGRRAPGACHEAAVLVPGTWPARTLVRELADRPGNVIVLDVDSAALREELAAAVAASLNRPLHRTTLAEATGRFIGETEKNLTPVLGRADEAGAVLFLDEAEALFGKRTEVADAADRYTDAEVRYLVAALRELPLVLVGASPERETLTRWRSIVQAVVHPQYATHFPSRNGETPRRRPRPRASDLEVCVRAW
jgi:hypothetical protein